MLPKLIIFALFFLSNAMAKTSFRFSSLLSSDLKEMEETDKALNLNLTLTIVHPLNKSTNLILVTPFNKSLTGTKELHYKDASLSVSKVFLTGDKKKWSLGQSITLGLPYSEYSRNQKFLQTKIGLSPYLNLKPFDSPLQIGLGLSLFKQFHRSHTDSHGQSNHEFINSMNVNLTYPLSITTTLSFSSSFIKYTTYGGNQSDYYSMQTQVSRSFGKHFKADLGIVNGGDPLDYKNEINIKIFDRQISQVYLKGTYLF